MYWHWQNAWVLRFAQDDTGSKSSGTISLQYFLGRGGTRAASAGSNSNLDSFFPVPWPTPAMSDCENNDL